MASAISSLPIERDAPVWTWFRAGGRADRLARPRSLEELRACLGCGDAVRVLGRGANLLVDDEGVGGLVVSLEAPVWREVRFGPRGRVVAGAGADLAKLIHQTSRRGLGGLEVLGGVPATVGGAVRMNAGGRYGEICEVVESVRAVTPGGEAVELSGEQAGFAYRSSALSGLIVVEVTFRLLQDEPSVLRNRLLAIMQAKKGSQPLSERSAGCCFKNPTLERDVEEVGRAGERIAAGLLIDRAGCKAMAVGGASVSERHANFIVAQREARARDVIELMGHVAERVEERFGVRLERELVVWGRGR